jgi:plasmid stabilization system protein ParE
MAKVIWTNKSLKDIKSIFDFISLDSSYYAGRFVSRLVQRVESIRSFSGVGKNCS